LYPRIFQPASEAREFPALQFRPGSIVRFFGRGLMSWGIEAITGGPSHVGIVCRVRPYGLILVESTTLCDLPDLFTGQRRQGVQAHHLQERIAAYDGAIEVMHLADGWELDGYQQSRLAKALLRLKGHGYSKVAAGISGTRLFKWTPLMPYPDLGNVFCSELAAYGLQQAHVLPPDENPAVYNPASLCSDLLRRGLFDKPVPVAAPKVAA
jgi:hypothetical protein